MVDCFLARLEPAALDSLINRRTYRLSDPYVHFPVAPLTAVLPKTLNSIGPFHRHGAHPLHSWRFREMTDSELAVESRLKNPFTIDRFSGGKLLLAESFSSKGGVNSHVKAQFRVIPSFTLDSMLRSIRPEVGLAIRHYDSGAELEPWLTTISGTVLPLGYLN
jgi:hypothetical protein